MIEPLSDAAWIRAALKARRKAERRPNGTFPKFVEPKADIGFPVALQASYSKLLVDYMQEFNKAFFGHIRPNLQGWVDAQFRGDSDGLRLDGVFLDIQSIKGRLKQMLEGVFGARSAKLPAAILGLGAKADKFASGRWASQVKDIVRAEFVPETSQDEHIKEWAETNLGLVKSLSTEYIEKMNEAVLTGVKQGQGYREIMDNLLNMAQGLSVNRAKLIAVDQLGKLHGAITMARFREAGLDLYEWRTSQDERVRGNPAGKYPNARPSHYAAHGMICRWDKPDLYRPAGSKEWVPRGGSRPSGFPGFPIRCRCHAKPIWAELIGELDAEIEAEMHLAA